MSRQLSMDNFFKTKSAPSPQVSKLSESVGKKRRSLSLKKPVTPVKTPKKDGEANIPSVEIFDLCSDEENQNEISQSNDSLASDLSQSTVIYELTPKTPQKTPQSASSFRSPDSANKFYSPSKKRVVKKLTPVKRSLVLDFFKASSGVCDSLEEEAFNSACHGMDDKTIFLLTIINKCLQDESLKNLLDLESQQVLSRCMDVVQPGMRLVCRLFWHQHIWYRLDKLKTIASEKFKPTEQLTASGESPMRAKSRISTDNASQKLDDPACHLMIDSLLRSGLLIKTQSEGDNCLQFDDYILLLKFEELKSLCKELMIKMTSKQQAKEALLKLSRNKPISAFLSSGGGRTNQNDNRILKMLEKKTGTCYKLSELARSSIHKLYLLMYLGIDYNIIREKKLELLLINDKVGRETYPVDKDMELDNASDVFNNSYEFLRYVAAHNIYEQFLAETDWKRKCAYVQDTYELYKKIGHEEMNRSKSLVPWLRRFTPANVYVKILEAGIQDLKRHKTDHYYAMAADILTTLIAQNAFRQHKKAEWYAEKALILHKLLHKVEDAAEVLLQGFTSLSSDSTDVLRPRARRLSSHTGLRSPLKASLAQFANKDTALESTLPGTHLDRKPMDNDHRGKIRFQTRTENLLAIQTAEQCCITHYLATGKFTHGEHWEGRIVCTIFFLLFWDIIYSKPPGLVGIFLSHYQRYPLDLFSDSFYKNRKTLIDRRLELIRNCTMDKLIDMLTDTWEHRSENEMSGVVYSIGIEAVCGVGRALGPRGAAAVSARLALDYGYAHSGFPDLTLWNVHTNKVMFVEVKTDADKPSMKQIQWMHYLKQNGIDTSFCYVGINTARSKARAKEVDSFWDSD